MKAQEYVPLGEERSFTVRRHRRKLARLVVELSGSSSDFLALKRSISEFADISIVELRKIVNGRSHEIGAFPLQNAAEMAALLRKEGLCVVETLFTQVSDLIIDERGPSAWLIEDAVENQRVVDDAIRRGVRIVEDGEPNQSATANALDLT